MQRTLRKEVLVKSQKQRKFTRHKEQKEVTIYTIFPLPAGERVRVRGEVAVLRPSVIWPLDLAPSAPSAVRQLLLFAFNTSRFLSAPSATSAVKRI
jgi:hypothetical protein